jgi:hypothetical protein
MCFYFARYCITIYSEYREIANKIKVFRGFRFKNWPLPRDDFFLFETPYFNISQTQIGL